MATTLPELTYDLSTQSLAQQEASLNELRSRTGVLLAATAIAIALLGGRALDDGVRTALDLAGVGLAVISFLLSVFVLAPKSQYVATVDPAAIHEYFKREEVDVGEAMEALVFSNREVWEENQLVIDRLVRAFRWACSPSSELSCSGRLGWRYSESRDEGPSQVEGRSAGSAS
jgi:hypothetical protein